MVHTFPLLEIKPPRNIDRVKQKLQKLNNVDLVIFVSVNAVEHTLKYIEANILDSIKIATTGEKTANLLRSNGITVDYCPDKVFNSEALLAMSEMRQFCKGRKIAIIRGENGRDFLRDSLSHIGAEVDYFDVYRRNCPQHNLDTIKQHWRAQKLDIILLSSGTSITNFFTLSKNEQWVDNLTLLLGSQRMHEIVPKHFKGKTLIAEDPSDETILEELNAIYG